MWGGWVNSLIPTCHLLIRSMTSRVNILTSCSSSISWDSGLSSAISSSPLPGTKRQVPWESKGSKIKESSDPHQHPAPGHSSSGSTQVCILKVHQRWTAVHWGTLSLVTLLGWMEGSGSKSRVGKGKKSLISTSGHSLVTACPNTNHPMQAWNDYTTAILVLG